jgi:hypothetical protein
VTEYQLPVGEGAVATFQTFTVELAIATDIGDLIKPAAAMKAAVAAIVVNREVGVFLKRVPFTCFPTFASPTQTPHDRFSTSRIFEPCWIKHHGTMPGAYGAFGFSAN